MNILVTHYLYSADDTSSCLGRVDYTSLPQQTLMEMVIDKITAKELICGQIDNPSDFKDWQGVTVSENDEVEKIVWTNLKGHLRFEWLPPTLQYLYIHENQIPGTIDTSTLPHGIAYMNLQRNQLNGSFNFTNLPPKLMNLIIKKEDFEGSIDLTNLPKGMRQLSIVETSFSGTVDLTQLPDSLSLLFLRKTHLHGPVDLTKLPQSIGRFNISQNDFSGETDFSNLPKSLGFFSVEDTKLSGRILCDEYSDVYAVSGSDVKEFVKFGGKIHELPDITLIDEGETDAPIYMRRSLLDKHIDEE